MLSNNPYIYLIKKGWYHSRNKRYLFVSGIFLTCISQFIYTLTPYLVGLVFDAIQLGGPNVFHNVRFWLIMVVLAKVLFWIIWWPGRIIERKNVLNATESFWETYYQKLLNLPYIWHQDHHSGNIISRINKGDHALKQFLWHHHKYVYHLGRFAAPLIFFIFVSPKIFLILISYSTFILFFTYKFDVLMAYLTKMQNIEQHKFSGVVFDYISNIMTILSLRLGQNTKKQMLKTLANYFPYYERLSVTNENKWALVSCSSITLQAVVLGYFIWDQLQTGSGIVAIGTTVAVYSYLQMFSQVFSGFALDYQKLVQWQADATSLDLIDEAIEHESVHELKSIKKSWQKIELKNAIFSYNQKSKKPNINVPELTLLRGKKIAFIGSSGAGKTTLLALLRGMLDFDQAQLMVDGKEQNLRKMQNITSLIPQDPEIFENTIQYNVTFGLSGRKEIVADMIKMACFDSVVDELPKGLKTNIKERGVNLSGGQKQRLALARSLFVAQKSDLILMDESTSSVDSATEYEIYNNIFHAWPDKTIIASIHRLNLLPLFDEVIVMKKGKIIQTGPVVELLKKSGPMKTLWDRFQKQQQHKNKTD